MAIQRALISVSDKTGLVPFAKELSQQGIEIISTGGTYTLLKDAGIDVLQVQDITGFPEMLDGRVKTLHPMIHGGLLGIRADETHQRQMAEHGIKPIDLVVVNLYPFKNTIAKPDVLFEDAIENIDIGGPAMLRSAAKNHNDVTVIVDADDYNIVLKEIKSDKLVSDTTKRRLASKVFRHTAAYDALIAEYLGAREEINTSETFTVTYEKVQDLRYGENPHQKAAFYRDPLAQSGNIATAKQLHGKELSYNNIADADAALGILREFEEPCVVAVKHMNPCGVGIGSSLEEAFQKAYEADPVSIFGGIVATNQIVDEQTAIKMKEIFLEIILAPSFTEGALDILKQKKNVRLLELGNDMNRSKRWAVKSVEGGMLLQEIDRGTVLPVDLKVVTVRQPSEDELKQLLFAWRVVKHVKSNAIVLVKDSQTIGVGAGQMNRVGSAKIAIEQAAELAKGSVLASDAFFPMADTVEEAAKAGITAIIQPGGSMRDQESIDEANKFGISMVFTSLRHFKH